MERRIMNRIGFSLLVSILLIGASCRSQSFFWSHNCCCDTVAESCIEDGLFYNRYAITDAREIANDGWHVSTLQEFIDMYNYIAGTSYTKSDMTIGNYPFDAVAGKLRDTTGWVIPNSTATNEYGFSARGAGVRNGENGVFSTRYFGAGFWLYDDTYFNTGISMGYIPEAYQDFLFIAESSASASVAPRSGFSVRLVKNSTTLSNGQTGTYIGNDGQEYYTICINGVEWTSSNLIETQFRNGDVIPWYGANPSNYFTNVEWAALTTAGMCAYNNNTSLVGCDFEFPAIEYADVNYGYLYNWYAATDINKISSSDEWVVPTLAQWLAFRNSLGTFDVVGGYLKETGLTHWLTPNGGASNAYSFNARGAGQRSYSTGEFALLGEVSRMVSYDQASSVSVNSLEVIYADAQSNFPLLNKKTGFSIRLMKTTTTLSHGQTGTYTGNDGKVYRTICIGTQEWLADNLCETEYRNGDPIIEVTDNATWAGLTTGARCSYNNLESNAINP